MKLQDIEKKYGFEFPELYKQLYLDGMLKMGEYGPNWYSEVYPKLRENPPLLLDMVEVLEIEQIDATIAWFKNPENYQQVDERFTFIPFAKDPGRNYYCFFFNKENKGDIPVIFVTYDSTEAEYISKNLQDFIFKMFLTDMAYIDGKDISDQELKNNLESMFQTHKKYLTHQQRDVLKNILNRKIIYLDEEVRSLLIYDEAEEIFAKIIPFDKMDTSFEYSTE